MDPLSMSLGALAAAMVTKAAETATEKTVDGISEASQGAFSKLWAWLRGRLGSRPELTNSIKYVGAASAREELAAVIDEEIATDKAATHELAQIVEDIQAEDKPLYERSIQLIQNNYHNSGLAVQSVYGPANLPGAADKSNG